MDNLAEYQKAEHPFEKYLESVHARDYHGTDDDMPDAFDDWLGSLDGEDYITHGNAFTKMLLDLIK